MKRKKKTLRIGMRKRLFKIFVYFQIFAWISIMAMFHLISLREWFFNLEFLLFSFNLIYLSVNDPNNISDGSTRNIKIKADLISGRLKVLLAGRRGPSSTAVAPPGLLPLTHRNIAEARSRNCCYLKFNGGSIMCPSIVGTRGAPGAPGASSGSLEIVSGSESKHFTLTVETAPGIGGSGGPGGPPLHSQYFPGSSLSSTLGLYILDYDNIEKYMTQCPFLPYYNENKALYNSNPGTVGPNGFKGPDNSKYEYCTSFKDQERTCVRN